MSKEKIMKKLFITGLLTCALLTIGAVSFADSILLSKTETTLSAFPDLSETEDTQAKLDVDTLSNVMNIEEAVWPFSKKDDAGDVAEVKTKSSRKAFFLSFLVPGLGEAYVGSKSWIAFLGVEAVSWYIYATYTGEGNDLESDFQNFANTHWNYDTTTKSDGSDLDHNYFNWVKAQLRSAFISDEISPTDFDLINERLEEAANKSISAIRGHSIHHLPETKTQQYYEMIGKYPQFVYGWEDIGDAELNPTIRNEDGSINNYVDITTVKSDLRMEYEDMRDDSNKKLKLGQRGVHLMLLNRVVSAIHAGRMAYRHNKSVDSELSSIRIDFAEKYIIDNKVPMIRLTKSF